MNKDLFIKLQSNRKEAASVLARPSLKGIRYSVIEKYSEQAHFVYELLQNADDAKATKVKLLLQKDGLVFIHNGSVKFTVTDPDDEGKEGKVIGHINAITSIGNSSKTELEIGKFGVGFKSVFQYTENPEIYEDEFKFRIEDFIVPILLENDHPLRSKGETLFFFPFNSSSIDSKQAYKDISEKFIQLENPLMFIKSLSSIEWETLDSHGNYSKKIEKKDCWNGADVCYIQTASSENSNEVLSNYIIFSEKIESSNDFEAVLAFQTDEGAIKFNKRFNPYCFFPTKEASHLKFIIQAPFLLIDNRQGIKRGNPWNISLISKLSGLLVKTLDYFIAFGFINDDFFNVLPIEKDFFDPKDIFYAFYSETKEALLQKKIFPTKEHQLVKINDAYIAESERILNLFSSEQISQLLGQKVALVFPTLSGIRRKGGVLSNYLFEELGLKELVARNIIKFLSQDFLETQSDEWLIDFYKYFSSAPNLFKELRLKPIIRTSEGEQVTPFNNAGELIVFLPTDFNVTFKTVKLELVEQEEVLFFLKQLGLEKPNLKAEVELKILPLYQKNIVSVDANLNYVSTFIQLYKELPSSEQNIFISKLKQYNIIEAVDNLVNEKFLTKPIVVYYKTPDLELFFQNYKEKINWLSESFIAHLELLHDKSFVRSFLDQLGITNYPKLYKRKIEINNTTKRERNLSFATTEDYSIIDYEIEGLEEALMHLSVDKSRVIWKFLISRGYVDRNGVYEYFYRTHKKALFLALHIKHLRNRAWLFSQNDEHPKMPKDILLEDLYDNEYYMEGPHLQSVIKQLNILHKGSPIDDIDWTDTSKKTEFFEKAQKYDEYSEYIEKIPKRKLEQLLKEQKILDSKNNVRDGIPKIKEDAGVKNGPYISKQDIINEFISIKSNLENNVSTELDSLQKKIETATIVETEEQKVLYATLMDLRYFSIELSHVINTALSKIIVQAEFFKENYPDKTYEELYPIYAEQIYYEVKRLKTVVKFMLSYTEAEKYYTDFDVISLIKYLFNDLHKDEIEAENITTELNLKDNITIHYNQKSFEDVISNLISNSIKALKGCESKKIKCSTNINHENKEFIIIFSDNGIGINSDIKDKIFDVYFTTTQEYDGAGVGLYIVKTKLKTLGGGIEVIKPEFPQGASFQINLPLK